MSIIYDNYNKPTMARKCIICNKEFEIGIAECCSIECTEKYIRKLEATYTYLEKLKSITVRIKC